MILLCAALVLASSCKNKSKEAEQQAPDYENASEAELVQADLKAEMQNLMESAKKIKPVAFISSSKDGSLVLSEKEKMVKPDYLIEPSSTNDLVNLTQKYRAIGMMTSDKTIAQLYDMPINEYNEAIFRILTDINDPALTNFYTLPVEDIETNREEYEIFVDQEYEEGRAQFFWEAVAAAMVEQIYIVTRDVDKFMPMFTDESASDITFNFICVHDALTKMVAIYPEMESLNEILTSLYVLNAISVEQLRTQLLEVKESIENARAALLK